MTTPTLAVAGSESSARIWFRRRLRTTTGAARRASVLGLLAIAGMLVVPTIVPQARRAIARAHAHGIPAALVRAIHARLGPGPIALGHAPLSSGIEPAAGGWKAKASAGSLAARIAPDGMVSARLGSSDAVSLTPVGLSSPGAFTRLSTGKAQFRDGRLVIGLGPATGAYQLTAGGLEQRFTVNRALSRNAQQLTLRFSSPVRWRSIRAGSAIVPSGVGDGHLAYAGLRVTDARGRLLRSHFALTARGPAIVTDTENAAYPITIDPTWTTTSVPTTTLNLGIQAGYATALSEDGNTALVGAQGAAYIFHASAEGSWASSSTPTATLTDGSDSQDALGDGTSVALSSDGTTALIGDPGANNGNGVVYVFSVSSEDSWESSSTPTATLTPSSYGLFGWSVALSSDGTTALIGAIAVNSGAGAAYVFHASAEDAWTSGSTPAATLTNTSGAAGDQIGEAVALSSDGTTALVGANFANGGTGAAYVFHTSAADAWVSSSTPTATLTNSSGSANDNFGSSVALSSDGTTSLISAGGAGAAYVYNVSAENAWASSAAPNATLTDSADDLGGPVALSSDGTTALIGGTDAAYIFHASAEGSWTSSSTPAAMLTSSSGSLGSSVALSSDGTTALIGDEGANDGAGAADVFHASGEGSWATSSTPDATLTGPSGPGGEYGYSVAVSSDGTTALIGAVGVNSGTPGAAYVFRASAEGSWASSSTVAAALTNSSGSAGDNLGSSVALSPDGTTALIGATGVNSGAGAAYVFHVSSEGSWASSSTPTATLTNSSGSPGDQLGSSVALSSNGTTALIGAAGINIFPGAAYVFHAAAEGSWTSSPTPTATLANSSGSTGDNLGSSVALSSDGTTALVGATGVNAYTGAAYVFHASAQDAWTSSPTPTATLTNSSGSTDGQFGASVALSSDGTTALIGAPLVNLHEGAASVYHVSSQGSWASSSTPTATLTKSSASPDDQLGSSVALSPDGTIALIGAIGFNGGTTGNGGAGAAYVFQASAEDAWASSSTPTATLTNGPGSFGDHLGSAVALSSDGTIALIGADSANGGAGGAYVFSPPSTTYTLTADTSGSGTGTVTTTDGAINCGSSCTSTYGSGSGVTLNAQPGLNSTFTGWSGGGCSGTGSCTIAISEDTSVTATFTFVAPPKNLTVSVTGTAGGVSSSPAGISCPGACAADFTPGTTVTLTATPASGGTFAGWSGPACRVTITGACAVTSMATPQTVSATFTAATVLPQEGLSVSLAGTGTGSVSSSPTGIACPGTCGASFSQGTVVTLTASPASGATFAGWSGAGCSGTGTCNVSMSSAQTVTATYTAISAKPSCTLVPQGGRVAVPAKPSKKHPLSGALKVAVRCDQPAAAKLTVTITAATKPPPRKKRGKSTTFTIHAIKATVTAGKTDTVSVKLPKSAVAALEAGARESVLFALTATNANGVGTATAKIARLKLVRTST
jgi:hypothetical protein